MKNKKLTFIDLFAGIGGIRLAFERNDCTCVFSSEWDQYCQKTYLANFGEVPEGDITQIDASTIPDHDILTGGFPCQPFSSIGKRQGFDHTTQGTLFFDVARIIDKKKPKAFLLENVGGLRNHDGGKTYQVIIKTLQKELGYWTDDTILDAADFGVPQHRKRIYIVGFSPEIFKRKDFAFSWPIPNKNHVGFGQYVEKCEHGYTISRHLQDSYLYKIPDGKPQVVTCDYDEPAKTLVASYHKIQRLTGTFVRDGATGLRLLSQNECKALMGFPSNFVIPVSRTQMYRQMGNSVAIPVVQAVAAQMVKTLKGEK